MEDIRIREQLFIEKRAVEYRSRGYEVSRDAPLDFFPGFRADLLVQKDDENKVIAVKTRTSIALAPEIAELAEVLSTMPGWSLDLLLVGEPEKLDAPEGTNPFSDEEIIERIRGAERAFEASLLDASFLLAWSACEAVLREMLSAEDFEIKRVTESDYILAYAASQGVITAADEILLSEMLACRNAIAHGFTVTQFDAEEQVSEVLLAARQLQRASNSTVTRQSDPSEVLNVLNPLEVRPRLDALWNFQAGWIDGVGIASSYEGFSWLSDTFETHYPVSAPFPHTYATPEGSVQMEWSFGDNVSMLAIDLNVRKGEWVSYERGAQEEVELTLDLNDHAAWAMLGELVRRISEVHQ